MTVPIREQLQRFGREHKLISRVKGTHLGDALGNMTVAVRVQGNELPSEAALGPCVQGFSDGIASS